MITTLEDFSGELKKCLLHELSRLISQIKLITRAEVNYFSPCFIL